MDLLLPLLFLFPFVALDDACTTVGGPAVNQVFVTIITMVVIFWKETLHYDASSIENGKLRNLPK